MARRFDTLYDKGGMGVLFIDSTSVNNDILKVSETKWIQREMIARDTIFKRIGKSKSSNRYLLPKETVQNISKSVDIELFKKNLRYKPSKKVSGFLIERGDIDLHSHIYACARLSDSDNIYGRGFKCSEKGIETLAKFCVGTLVELANNNIVHGDVHLSNWVFHSASPKLIDFALFSDLDDRWRSYQQTLPEIRTYKGDHKDSEEDPSDYGKKHCKTYETFVVNNSLEKKVKLFEIKSPEDLKTVIKTLDITYFCIYLYNTLLNITTNRYSLSLFGISLSYGSQRRTGYSRLLKKLEKIIVAPSNIRLKVAQTFSES